MPTHAALALRCALLLSLSLLGPLAQAQNASTAGAASAPEPTLENLSLVWEVTGDANNNGVVGVRFRAQGSSSWRTALPLRRVPAGSNVGFSWSHRHAGSVFGLQPGTDYELELNLVDPDGGNATRQLTARTRSLPAPGSGSVRSASPASLASVLSQAQPGDIVELGAGSYAGFNLQRDGTAGQPLTLRGLPGAQINGELGLFGRRHVILQALTVNGRIRFNGSDDISILDSTVNASATQFNGDGIACFTRCARAYIAGNTVNGTTLWQETAFGVDGDNRGEGIVVTGPGHVIRNNRVRGFRDGISFMEDSAAVDQYSIDVIDNRISESGDDGIEADFCLHNCRQIGNVLTNSFIAFSSQPALGGPNYFIRNIAWNVAHVPFKLYRSSRGDVLLHNTIVKTGDAFNASPGAPIAHAYARNNLFVGGEPGTWNGYSSGSGRVLDIVDLQSTTSSFNYNGYGTTRSDFRGRLGAVSFSSLAELRSLSSETQAQRVDMGVFASAPPFPQNPLSQYAEADLRLADDARAVDAGEVLPNINDDYSGSGPDLGAIERITTGAGLFCDGFEPAACSEP